VIKKNPIHPRLYVDIKYFEQNINLSFVDNSFNENGSRVLKNKSIQIVEKKTTDKIYLNVLNKLEYVKLIKYITIQKKVLEKHQKSGNYDSSRIVKSSILVMEDFKDSFENWFKNKSEY
tara:strand:- start:300 stop:656 length:357 start_codon:yes stop_codon:yes gene_type:complete